MTSSSAMPERSSRAGALSRAVEAAARFLVAVILVAGLRTSAAASEREPPVPPGTDPGGVAVALIDTGVNYTLPAFAGRLARDGEGRILGFDFHDNDAKPFDLAPGQPAANGRRHGTSVASVLLREAPRARLIPYRYRQPFSENLAEIVAHIARGPARIVSMSFGGYKREEWEPLARAIAAHPELLFIISSGNEGRNVDLAPIYPAAFALPNVLVVASSDPFGRLPPASNWGPKTVDISTPGERIPAIDFTGADKEVSGSSYAVPRIAALAARLKAANPGWDAARL